MMKSKYSAEPLELSRIAGVRKLLCAEAARVRLLLG